MPALSSMWPIDETSFRALVRSKFRPYRAEPGTPHRSLRGDAAVRNAVFAATHAVELPVPAPTAWAWVAQIMRGAGMYGWDALENSAVHSSDHLVRGLPAPTVGDRVGEFFELIAVEPGHELVWRSLPGVVLLGLPLPGVTLDYRVEPGADSASSTLIIRLRGEAGPLTHQAARHVLEVLDFILPRQQTVRLKNYAARAAPGAAVGNGAVHQAVGFRPAG